MRHWIDNETGRRMCEPDCTYEWLFYIWAIGCDYDGCQTVDEFKKLVDELVDYSQKAQECLRNGKNFSTEEYQKNSHRAEYN